MIVRDNLEFHAAALAETPLGCQLLRVPPEIAATLEPNGRGRLASLDSVGTEIRFVTDAPTLRISLSAIQPDFGFDTHDVRVMCGPFELPAIRLRDGVLSTVTLNRPAILSQLKPETMRPRSGWGFAPNIWRFISNHGGLIFNRLDTLAHPVRPPRPEEKPALTALCYGTSITNSNIDGYPFVMARCLDTDVLNLGFSGSCFLEKGIVDWLATQCPWDFAVLDIGPNMVKSAAQVAAFPERADYLLASLLGKNPGKPVFVLTVFPSMKFQEYRCDSLDNNYAETVCETIRALSRKYQVGNKLHLIEGREIMTDFRYLKFDGAHPGVYGHAMMGRNLADRIAGVLNA